MERRSFIGRTLAGGALAGSAAGIIAPGSAQAAQSMNMKFTDDCYVEHAAPGKPHKGKVLAAIQPHYYITPLYVGGTVAKLIKEGYTGYLIRLTNDETSGAGTLGEGTLNNEIDCAQVAKSLGLEKAIELHYRKHRMDDESIMEMRARLIFLFRALKIDTVIFFDPWDHYEENPDNYMMSRAVDAACWHSGGGKDYPEHAKLGIMPHSISERYYYARYSQEINRVVDISSVIDKKIESNAGVRYVGPAANAGVKYRDQLAQQNKMLPLLAGDDFTANSRYVKEFLLEDEKKLGQHFGLEYAEAFHYVGPGFPLATQGASHNMTPTREDYTNKNAKPLR